MYSVGWETWGLYVGMFVCMLYVGVCRGTGLMPRWEGAILSEGTLYEELQGALSEINVASGCREAISLTGSCIVSFMNKLPKSYCLQRK